MSTFVFNSIFLHLIVHSFIHSFIKGTREVLVSRTKGHVTIRSHVANKKAIIISKLV